MSWIVMVVKGASLTSAMSMRQHVSGSSMKSEIVFLLEADRLIWDEGMFYIFLILEEFGNWKKLN